MLVLELAVRLVVEPPMRGLAESGLVLEIELKRLAEWLVEHFAPWIERVNRTEVESPGWLKEPLVKAKLPRCGSRKEGEL